MLVVYAVLVIEAEQFGLEAQLVHESLVAMLELDLFDALNLSHDHLEALFKFARLRALIDARGRNAILD